jgi:hypothetical protein
MACEQHFDQESAERADGENQGEPKRYEQRNPGPISKSANEQKESRDRRGRLAQSGHHHRHVENVGPALKVDEPRQKSVALSRPGSFQFLGKSVDAIGDARQPGR